MFLWNILRRNKTEAVSKVYQVQKLKKMKNDWYSTVQNDKRHYELPLDDEDIALLSKSQFKRTVEKHVNRKSYEELVESRKFKAQDLIKNLKHNKDWKVPTQEYLKSNKLSKREKQHLFSLRSKSYNLKSNMKNQFSDDMSCRICGDEESIEDEKHTFEECEELQENSDGCSVKVEDLNRNTRKQIDAIKVFSKKMTKRDLILEDRNK